MIRICSAGNDSHGGYQRNQSHIGEGYGYQDIHPASMNTLQPHNQASRLLPRVYLFSELVGHRASEDNFAGPATRLRLCLDRHADVEAALDPCGLLEDRTGVFIAESKVVLSKSFNICSLFPNFLAELCGRREIGQLVNNVVFFVVRRIVGERATAMEFERGWHGSSRVDNS